MKKEDKLDHEIQEAADKALASLARYKFVMFGYWAGGWVHLNRTEGRRRRSAHGALVHPAPALRPLPSPLSDLMRVDV